MLSPSKVDDGFFQNQLDLSHAVIIEMQSQLVASRRSATEAAEDAAGWRERVEHLEKELDESRSELAGVHASYEKHKAFFRKNMQKNFARCSALDAERAHAKDELEAIQERLISFSAQVSVPPPLLSVHPDSHRQSRSVTHPSFFLCRC